MNDLFSDVLVAVIAICTYSLFVLLPRDPLVRRMSARRSLRRLRKGVR